MNLNGISLFDRLEQAEETELELEPNKEIDNGTEIGESDEPVS